MDERTTHGDDEPVNTDEDDFQDTGADDDTTPADTDEDGEPKTAERVKEEQKLAWLKNIRDGKKTLDDMPKNLEWLKKDVQEELDGGDKPKLKGDDLDDKIRNVLTEREAKDEFDFLVEDLQSAEISAEQEAQLKEEYEDLLKDFPRPTHQQKVKALLVARRLVGLKDNTSTVRDRRRQGMSLPPLSGTRRRSTARTEDKITDAEKRLGGNLPPGYKA